MAADMPGPQTQQELTATTYTQQLLELQQLLHVQQSSKRSPTDTAAADTAVSQLRQATAALQKLHQTPQQHLGNARQKSSVIISNAQACAAAAACMQALAQLLRSPPAELYSDPSGSPCQPPEGLELAGEQQQLVAAAQIQLLVLLVQLMDGLEAPQQQQQQQQQGPNGSTSDNSRARNKPEYFEGIVVIEELSDDGAGTVSSSAQQQLQQQVVQALLVAAVYVPGSSSSDSSSGSSSDSSGSSTACDVADHQSTSTAAARTADNGPSGSNTVHTQGQTLDCFCDRVVQQGLCLSMPWSGPTCQQHAELLLQELVGCVQLPSAVDAASGAPQSSQHTSSSGPLSSKQQQGRDHMTQPQQQEQQQELVCCLLPLLLDNLRDTLLAQHRHRQQQGKGGSMVTYTGPSTFQRCLAARQLAWLVQQLQPPLLSDPTTLGLLLPLMLAIADDPSPAVRQYGHAALGWLGLKAGVGELQWQGALLREETRRLVVGCEESCWPTAMPAATSLIMALEGKDQRSTAYHSLVLELLQEAERTAHKPQPRLIFMACVARLVPRLGLYVVRHFAALMPLLLEWTHAYDAESSVVALQVLGQLVLHAWPRMGVHAALVRQHAHEVLRQERVEQGDWQVQQPQQPQQQQEETECGAAASGDVGSRDHVSTRCRAAQQLLQLLDGL